MVPMSSDCVNARETQGIEVNEPELVVEALGCVGVGWLRCSGADWELAYGN